MKNSDKTGSSIAVLLTVSVVYSVMIISFYHYVRMTGDSTLYLSIAEKYLRGDFQNAVNGYWGPLLSWLLVPFLFFGASHVLAINAVNLLLGLLTIFGVWRLSFRFEMTEGIRNVLLFSLLPALLFISTVEPMDFLLLCVLVYYLNVVFNTDYPERPSNGAVSGALGALAYFSKPFGLPFFLSHFTLMNACHYFRKKSRHGRKNVLRNFAVGIVMFTLLSGIWIGLISSKYGHFTFSNQGRGVFASLGPGSRHDTLEKGDPIFYEGFFAPPNETAHVIYEDPTYARKTVWNPLKSDGAFRHFIKNLAMNIVECVRILESYSRLAIPIIFAYVLLLFDRPLYERAVRFGVLYPLLTVALYTAGYLPFHFETRYLWIVNILLLLMGGHVMHVLFRSRFFDGNIKKGILVFIFVLSFIVTPLKAYLDRADYCINSQMHDLGMKLNDRYDIRGNIASNREVKCVSTHDSWHKTFRLSYWLDSRYFGQAREGISDAGLERELKENNIDYYFFWGSDGNMPAFLSEYREITGGEMTGLRIFSLKERLPEAAVPGSSTPEERKIGSAEDRKR